MHVHFDNDHHATARDIAAAHWLLEHGAANLQQGETLDCQTARIDYSCTPAEPGDKRGAYKLTRWHRESGKWRSYTLFFTPGRCSSLREELRRKWQESMKKAELDKQPELALNY